MAPASEPRDPLAPPPAPGWHLIALELRAPWELWSLLPSWPLLSRAPTGDGHPVLVFPGLTASDGSTLPIRAYLKNLGYDVSGWNQGYNFGPRAGVLETARQQIMELAHTTGRKVSLVGWSLGGIYAANWPRSCRTRSAQSSHWVHPSEVPTPARMLGSYMS